MSSFSSPHSKNKSTPGTVGFNANMSRAPCISLLFTQTASFKQVMLYRTMKYLFQKGLKSLLSKYHKRK